MAITLGTNNNSGLNLSGVDNSSYSSGGINVPQNYTFNPNVQSNGIVATLGPPQTLGDSTKTPSNNAVDPFAAQRASFNTQKQGIYSSALDAANNSGITLNRSILDSIHSLTLGQQGIDQQGVQNDLARQQGLQGIQGMVSRGIQSGGVTLANKNASDSSAADAIARAYGQIGQRQASSVGQQYAQGQNDLAIKQKEQDYQVAQAPGKVHDTITQTVNGIVSQAQQQFEYLDSQMTNASLPDRIAIAQEKENIRQQALAALQGFDSQIQQGVGGIHAATPEQNKIAANDLANSGTSAATPYNYTSAIPAQFQDTGPFASELPIFTFGGAKKQSA